MFWFRAGRSKGVWYINGACWVLLLLWWQSTKCLAMFVGCLCHVDRVSAAELRKPFRIVMGQPRALPVSPALAALRFGCAVWRYSPSIGLDIGLRGRNPLEARNRAELMSKVREYHTHRKEGGE